MTKLSLPKLPKVSKTILLVSAGVLVVAGLIGTGAVQKVRSDRAEAAQTGAVRQELVSAKAEVQHLKGEVAATTKQATADKQRGDLACLEIKRLDGIRAITAQVVVPQYCL